MSEFKTSTTTPIEIVPGNSGTSEVKFDVGRGKQRRGAMTADELENTARTFAQASVEQRRLDALPTTPEPSTTERPATNPADILPT